MVRKRAAINAFPILKAELISKVNVLPVIAAISFANFE